MENDNYKNDIKRQLIDELSDTVGLEDKEILNVIDSKIEDLERNVSPLKLKEKLVLRKSIYDSLKNYDILTEVLEDKNINEIMINSYDEIFIDKNGKYQRWDKSFESKEQLENIIQQIVGKINRIVNISNPIVDARLSDGSRVHIVLPPIAIKGATVTIRKFPEKITMKKLIEYGSINIEVAKFLEKLVKNGYNIFISGGTGSGKTTYTYKTIDTASGTGARSVSVTSLSEGSTLGVYYVILNTNADPNTYATIADTLTGRADTGETSIGSNTSIAQSTLSSGTWTAVAVPEPTSGLLLVLGMAGLALRRKRA